MDLIPEEEYEEGLRRGLRRRISLMNLIPEEEWTRLTYLECKKLDEKYGTLERSPLHRSRRFPVQWAEELEG